MGGVCGFALRECAFNCGRWRKNKLNQKKHISNLQVSKEKKLLVVRILRIVRTMKLVHANDRGV